MCLMVVAIHIITINSKNNICSLDSLQIHYLHLFHLLSLPEFSAAEEINQKQKGYWKNRDKPENIRTSGNRIHEGQIPNNHYRRQDKPRNSALRLRQYNLQQKYADNNYQHNQYPNHLFTPNPESSSFPSGSSSGTSRGRRSTPEAEELSGCLR